jgi:hypothetical protein
LVAGETLEQLLQHEDRMVVTLYLALLQLTVAVAVELVAVLQITLVLVVVLEAALEALQA